MDLIITLEYREHMQNELERFINYCELCNEVELARISKQLLYALEKYSERK